VPALEIAQKRAMILPCLGVPEISFKDLQRGKGHQLGDNK